MKEITKPENLTSLMKEKFGVVKSSSLKLTEKDTVYTAFRKIADNIYKNGEWSVEDEMKAVETMMRNRHFISINTGDSESRIQNGTDGLQTNIEVMPSNSEERLKLGGRAAEMTVYKAIATKNQKDGTQKTKTTFVLLDPANKNGTVHNTHYYFEDIKEYPDGTESAETIYYALGNKNRAIGYDRLQRDVLKVFDGQANDPMVNRLSRAEIEEYLRNLSNPNYSGKNWLSRFQRSEYGELTDEFLATLPRDESVRYWGVPPTEEEIEAGREAFNYRDISGSPDTLNKLNLDKAPYILENTEESKHFIFPKTIARDRKHDQLVGFIQNYIDETYDIFLQREYEKGIEKQVRASAWQTKKNINKETQELMESTSLNEHFGFVEVDNDVDLSLYKRFEQEMDRVYRILPTTESKPDLRLRKLGNYHALGLYNPGTQTIAIDFRDYSDNIAGIGVQSFVHEYGHFLDYTTGTGLLSMQNDFSPFVARYRENITTLAEGSYVRSKSSYYGTPTEVFARSFEVYASECGLESSFIKSNDAYKMLDAYSIIDSEMRTELTLYFDKQFPDLKRQINQLKEGQEMEKQAPEQENDLVLQLGDFSEKELEYLGKVVSVSLHE